MEKISDRLLEVLNNENISARSLEQRIGASHGVISRCISKGTDISSIWVSKIITIYPRYSAKWMLTGAGPMMAGDQVEVDRDESPVKSSIKESPTQCELCERKDKLLERLENQLERQEREIERLNRQLNSLDNDHGKRNSA